MSTIKIHRCRWSCKPQEIKRTLQIGRFYMGTHFKGVSSLDIGILSTAGAAGIGYAFSSKPSMEDTTIRTVFFARWKMVTIHAGRFLFKLTLCEDSRRKQDAALEMGKISK